MKFISLIIFLSFFSLQVQGQQIDTLYDYFNKKEIRKIIFTKNDTIRTVKYWKEAIRSIEYTTTLKGCHTSIHRDTFFDSSNKIRLICENKASFLSNANCCDSLLSIKSYFKYKKGQLVEKASFKRIGNYSDCPCGTWEFIQTDQANIKKEFTSCDNSTLDNIIFVETIWSPDKEYCLELYKEKMLFAMPGQGSDQIATLVLKDKNGNTLNYVSGNSNSDEKSMYRDLEIKWDMEKSLVEYGLARSFELKNNSCKK